MGNFHILKPAFKVNRNKEVSILCNLVEILKQCYIYTNSVTNYRAKRKCCQNRKFILHRCTSEGFFFPKFFIFALVFFCMNMTRMTVSRRNPISTNRSEIVHRTKTFFFFHHNKYQELTLNGGTLSPSITFQNTEDTFNVK